ncbi:hypothetical protein [Rhizobium sp. SGZ-381]|uniref:hypothetical protein n=1 Tax=Rhizobium sp. SGZ-381 TaxID=3342800 RepID=UPI00366DCCBD
MALHMGEIFHRQQSRILIGIAATGLLVGGLLSWFAQPVEAGWIWSAATAPVLLKRVAANGIQDSGFA